MSKRNLDQLFQEKFSGFTEKPDDKVWTAIEASLDKKKKRPIVPIWWKLGGIAATLALGLLLYNPFKADNLPQDKAVTNKEFEEVKKSEVADPATFKGKDKANPGATEVVTDKSTPTHLDASDPTLDKESSDHDTNHAFENISSNQDEVSPTRLASSEKNEAITNDAKSTSTQGHVIGQIAINEKEIPLKKDSQSNDGQTSITGNSQMDKRPGATLAQRDEKENTQEEQVKKKSIFDAMEEPEATEIAEKSGKRWSAGPSVAPVYYDAIGKGSPVSSMFSTNSKSGNINMSYGLSVAYEISPKLSIRSGLHKVDYGYTTNDVHFTSSIAAFNERRIANIDYAETAGNLVVSSSNATLEISNKISDVSARTASRSGVMAQQFGYLEVPVELSYALVNNNFGINLIGGVSSLFLVDNEVDLTSGNLTTQMGSANNVNDLNFSANLGIGLDYRFSEKLRFNLEPVFKYQLNTFSNVDGTFNPYAIGVYSGLRFKF